MSNLRSCRMIREGNFCPALCKADDSDPKAKRLLRQLCCPSSWNRRGLVACQNELTCQSR
jgi:hypothetical protein